MFRGDLAPSSPHTHTHTHITTPSLRASDEFVRAVRIRSERCARHDDDGSLPCEHSNAGGSGRQWVRRGGALGRAPGGPSTMRSAANANMTNCACNEQVLRRARVHDVDLAGACKRIQIVMATAVGRRMRIIPIRAEAKIGDVQRGLPHTYTWVPT